MSEFVQRIGLARRAAPDLEGACAPGVMGVWSGVAARCVGDERLQKRPPGGGRALPGSRLGGTWDMNVSELPKEPHA